MKKLLVILFSIATVFVHAQTGNIVVPSGHALKVEKVVLDKQGKYLYTVETAKIIMWDAKTHEQLYTFPLGADKISNLAVSNDGSKIAVGCNTYAKCFSTITGKELILGKEFYAGNWVTFSPDSKSLYTVEFGIDEYNFVTQQKTKLVRNDLSRYDTSIEALDDNHVITYTDLGWKVWNLATKSIDFEYRFEKQAWKQNFLSNLNCIAYQIGTDLMFRDINTGKLLKMLPIKRNEYMVIPSADNKHFIFNDGQWQDENKLYTVYNGTTFLPVSKLNLAKVIDAGYFKGTSNTLFASSYSDVYRLNTSTGKLGSKFKRQVADLGMDVFNSLEYNYATGVLNLMTDDSVYKSVNLVKLNPFRHKPIPNSSDIITFSSTGDTVAVFSYKKAYVKDLVSGKMIQPAIKLLDEAANNARKVFFFDKNAKHVFYTTFSIPRQLYTVNRMDVKTGLVEKPITFKMIGSPYIHPDKDLIAGIVDYLPKRARVWNTATGKLLFDKALANDKADFISVSNDKKKVLLVQNNTTEIYDMATAKLISKSAAYSSIEEFSTYACTPDLTLLFKCEYSGRITAIDATGKPTYWPLGHISSIRNAFFSPDSKVMYTVSTDQTIKVWQPKTGKLLGTLYLFNDGNDYVFLDPYGRFDGTEGGIKRMYYFRDRIKISLDVVYEKFYTPNLYQRLINGENFDPINIIINPQPLVKISYAQLTRNLEVVDDKTPAYKNTSGVAEITVNATAENDKIDEIRLFHNGKIVNLATRGLIVTDNTSGTDTKKYTVNLLPGMNKIRAVALNSQRTESKPDEIEVSYSAGGSVNQNTPAPVSNGIVASVDRNATLHLIVVGINKYQNEKMSLNYALADATAFKNETELGAKTMIANVKTYFVTDEKANKNGIVQAFTEVQTSAKPQDVFVFYYAGHGVISQKNKEFYLVPTDVTDLHNVDEALAQKGIPSKLLQQYAIDIAAQKQVFILDACQSAGAFEAMLASDGNQQKSLAVVARSTGTHWIAASGSQQFANEFSSLGHGVFTYVLLKALKGEAANNKMITVNGLKNFLQQGVPALMKKYNGAEQYPASYGLGSDFPVEIIK